MEQCYKFAVVRFEPDKTRGETLNIGVVVFTDSGLDVRLSRRLERVRALSAALDANILRELAENLRLVDSRLQDSGLDEDERLAMLSHLGPLALSEAGTFQAEGATAYENRLEQIFRVMVDPEPASPRFRAKRSRLLTQVKSLFRQERVLAKKTEGLESHRIVSSFELEKGLVADFVLKNGAMHVIETVDASSEDGSLRKAIGEIGTAALVLERARMTFGEHTTKSKLVFSASAALEKVARPSLEAAQHQGAEIVNWESADDRNKFLLSLSALATPIERKSTRQRIEGSSSSRLRFQ